MHTFDNPRSNREALKDALGLSDRVMDGRLKVKTAAGPKAEKLTVDQAVGAQNENANGKYHEKMSAVKATLEVGKKVNNHGRFIVHM